MSRLLEDYGTLVIVLTVVALAAAVRMPFWLSATYAYGHGDAIIWEVWSRSIHQNGFINVFRTADSNNVGYHYVLWPTSAIYARISPEYELWTAPIRILIKIPPFLADLGLGVLVFFAARSLDAATSTQRDVRAGLAALAFVLAPATIYDSMWWSQIDSIITLCMLASVMLLVRGHAGWAWAVWMVGVLVKPQPIVLLPVLATFTLLRHGPRRLAQGMLSGAAAALAVVAPFLLHGDGRLILKTYGRMFEQDPIDLAQGAWNGWSLLDMRGNPRPVDALFSLGGIDVTYAAFTLGLSALATVVVVLWLARHCDYAGLLAASAMMVFTFYMLPTSTHERYLYPAFALAAPLLIRHPRLIPLYAALATTFFLNLLAINPPNASEFWQWHATPFAAAVASANVAMYAGAIVWIAADAVPRKRAEPARALPVMREAL